MIDESLQLVKADAVFEIELSTFVNDDTCSCNNYANNGNIFSEFIRYSFFIDNASSKFSNYVGISLILSKIEYDTPSC